jgi:hypothetical protein
LPGSACKRRVLHRPTDHKKRADSRFAFQHQGPQRHRQHPSSLGRGDGSSRRDNDHSLRQASRLVGWLPWNALEACLGAQKTSHLGQTGEVRAEGRRVWCAVWVAARTVTKLKAMSTGGIAGSSVSACSVCPRSSTPVSRTIILAPAAVVSAPVGGSFSITMALALVPFAAASET